MSHHAYFVPGNLKRGVEAALAFGKKELGLSLERNPDVIVLRYELFSVEDARMVSELISRTGVGDVRLIVISASRIFHEAQNALLKSFEEPPAGTYLVLAVSSEGVIIQTLRSRLAPLPGSALDTDDASAEEFLRARGAAREKLVEKILTLAKKDAPEEKQAARREALELAQGLVRRVYALPRTPATLAFLADLDRLIPILHDRSAPLKPILEHLSIVCP